MLYRADVIDDKITVFKQWEESDSDFFSDLRTDREWCNNWWMAPASDIRKCYEKHIESIIAQASNDADTNCVYMVYVPGNDERALDFFEEMRKRERSDKINTDME